ncbi:MAG TPA: hypothetical protein VEI03_15945 [Stellaceae bacterium]|nr:hypothetical protein [Stellaceae bacterium]
MTARPNARRAIALAVLLLPAGCAQPEAPELLSPLLIRSYLVGHLVEVSAPDRDRYLIRFEHGDRAVIVGETADFARWYADAELGLCIQYHDQGARCAPLFAVTVAHYRWGDATLNDLTIRDRRFDFRPDIRFERQFDMR